MDKTAGEILGLRGTAVGEALVRKANQVPGTATENALANSRPVKVPQPTEESLQTAARIKILLEAGRIAAFTGLTPHDGATPLLIQVGISLATIDPMPVLLIDANSRRPMLHESLDIPQSTGLTDCLAPGWPLEAAVRPTTLNNLFILPHGESDSNLPLRLSTPEAERLFGLIRERYRYILIDAGVILKSSEGMMISAISDGVVIAMAAGKRRQHEVREYREGLERLKLRLLGIVLTRNLPRKK